MAQLFEADDFSDYVKFLPYAGEEYLNNPLVEIPMLLLGYSHKHNGELDQDFTRNVVENVMRGDTFPGSDFFAKVRRLFSPVCGPERDVAGFWPKVAFYNYIQEFVTPGRAPTAKMWRNAIPAFQNVLNVVQPKFVLVLSAMVFHRLHALTREGPPIIRENEEPRSSRLYVNQNVLTLLFGIDHPSSRRGWHVDVWRRWVDASKEAAITLP